jgi:AAA domain
MTALAALTAMPNWVVWKYEKNEKGKPTKIPYQALNQGRKASSTSRSTWATYAEAVAASKNFNGTGFVLFESEFVAFDLDNCRNKETGVIDPWALDLVAKANTYTEISPSGTGLRLIGTGTGAKVHRKQPVANGVSCETFRKAERFITITGNRLLDTPDTLNNLDALVDATVAELDGKKEKHNGHTAPTTPLSTLSVAELFESLPAGLKKQIAGEPYEGEDTSRTAASVAERLFSKGYSKDQVTTLFKANPKGIGKRYAEGKDLEADIERLGTKFQDTSTASLKSKLLQSSAEFVAHFVPPDYLVEGILQRRYVYSLTAPTHSGKTCVALRIAAHVSLGLELAGCEVSKGRVVYFAGENPDDVRARWIKLCEDMGQKPDEMDVFFLAGTPPIGNAEIRQRINAESERLGPISLAIIDTSAAYFRGDDENSNAQLGEHARMMRTFTDLPGGPTVIVTCHPPKNPDMNNLTPRGGGSFVNEMDGNLVCLRASPTAPTVSVHWHVKFRGPDFPAITFKFAIGTSEKLKDSKGKLFTTISVEPITQDDKDDLEEIGRGQEDRLLLAMHGSRGQSLKRLAEQLGWHYKNGDADISRVHRMMIKLQREKLVTKDRDHYRLTKTGTTTAKALETAPHPAQALFDRLGTREDEG